MKNDEKFESVCQFYALTHKLKNLLRSGWLQWKIDAKRVESVAEHIYGTQMLAFAVNSQFDLGLDIEKVAFMLAFHELGETMIGDITVMDGISKTQKDRMEVEAVIKILEPLKDGERIRKIFMEFEEKKTKEAKFAYFVDKFECNLQIKYHGEMGESNISTDKIGEEEKLLLQDPNYKDCKNIAELWIKYHKLNSGYDALFQEFAGYILTHDIFKK